MKIKDWPATERPREKLYSQGTYQLSDAELLAIIIGKGVRNRTALDLAREILNHVGSLRKLCAKKPKDLEKLRIQGLGRTKIVQITAALELGHRSLSQRNEHQVTFSSPKDVHGYYHPLISGLKYELFKVAAVDGKNALIRDTTISKGILDASLTHPREVFKFALEENAHSIFLIHNHPSGILKPSEDDLKVTERLCSAGELMGVRVVDHIIVTENNYYSFTEHNLL